MTREIEACRACRLAEHRTRVVVYRGAPSPRILFVGEAPGAEEDREGRPFVGRSGRRLEAALQGAGIPGSATGFVNLIKCRPPGNRFDRAAAATCRPYLDRQIALLDPRLLVPMGAHALAALDPAAPPITQCAGRVRAGPRVPLFPLLHPAAALHDPRLRERWARDVRALADWASGSQEIL